MKLSFFPGCSLKGTAAEYTHSIVEVARLLDIELQELPDWNCCGASSAHMTDQELGLELSARNLALAEEAGRDLLVPCSACFQRLRAADLELRHDSEQAGRAKYGPDFRIIHVTQLLAEREIQTRIRKMTARSLAGLKVACYYGCLSVRPPAITGAQDYESPRGLDQLMAAVGAEGVRWSHKTECCSGSLTMARPDIARELIADIVNAARRGGAQALVTDCPMCQANLESRQTDLLRSGAEKILPVFFGTELVAYALSEDQPEKPWKKHLIDPTELFSQLGL